ncbi:MAG: sporulation protein YabP [Clostridia bacterium]|nr:sporulation protein YabP [Clostridia bacterium]
MESSKHTINLDNREKLVATGITDILSFDEENIVAQTENGILVIRGYNLHINSLNLEKGSLTADGNVYSLSYDNENSSKRSLLGRLFK